MFDLILHLLYDVGVFWVAAGPNCAKCGGEGIRPRKQSDGNHRWHCRECCHEWTSSRLDVITGKDNASKDR